MYLTQINLLEKIGNNAVILLNEHCMRLAVTSTESASPKVYSEFNVHTLFIEYKIESQSSNAILIEVDLHHLSKALTKSKHASQVC